MSTDKALHTNNSLSHKVSEDCPSDNSLDKCARMSAKNGQSDLAKRFMSQGATDVETVFISSAESGSPLMSLVPKVDSDTIETAAAHAAMKGYRKIAKDLYRMSPTQDCLDQILAMSVLGGKKDMIRWCLKHGAEKSDVLDWLVGKNVEKVLKELGEEKVTIAHLFGVASGGRLKDLRYVLDHYRTLSKEERLGLGANALMNGNIHNFEALCKGMSFGGKESEFMVHAARGGSLYWTKHFARNGKLLTKACCVAAAHGRENICKYLDELGSVSEEVLLYCGYSGKNDLVNYFTSADNRKHRLLLAYGAAAGGNWDYVDRYLPDDVTEGELVQVYAEAIEHSRLNVLRELRKRNELDRELLEKADGVDSLLTYLGRQRESHKSIKKWMM